MFARICLIIVLVASGLEIAEARPAREPSINTLVKRMGSRRVSVRLKATKALGRRPGAAGPAIPLLTRLLRDRNSAVRYAAADVLARVGDRASMAEAALIKAFKAAYAKNGDDNIAKDALEALERLGSRPVELLPQLRRIISNTYNNTWYRVHALNRLAAIGPPDKAAPLVIKLLDDKEGNVRFFAIRACSQLGARAKVVIPRLKQITKATSQAPEFRREAAISLVKLGHPQLGLPVLFGLLKDKDSNAITHVVPYLKKLVTKPPSYGQILDVLRHTVVHNYDFYGRDREDALAEIPMVAPLLQRALADKKANWVAANVLGRLGRKAAPAVPALTRLLRSSDDRVRSSAAGALEKIGPPAATAVPELIKALDRSKNHKARMPILGALEAMGTKAAPALVPRTIKLFKKADDKYERIRLLATLRVAGPRAAAAVPMLLEMSRKLGEPSRAQKMHTLAVISVASPLRSEVVQTLLKIFNDKEEWRIKGSVAVALGHLGDHAAPAVPALVEALSHKKSHVRWCAVFALGRIPSRAAATVPRLLRALKDANSGVGENALEALGRLTRVSKAAAAAHRRALGHREVKRRRIAAKALKQCAPSKVLVQALTRGIKTESDAQVHAMMVEGLGLAGPLAAEAAPVLIQLYSRGRMKKEAVAKTLLKLGDTAIAALNPPLRGKHPVYTYDAAVIARVLGSKAAPALPGLAHALGAKNPAVRREVIATLREVGQKDRSATVPEAVGAIFSKSASARHAARVALDAAGRHGAGSRRTLARATNTRAHTHLTNKDLHQALVLLEAAAAIDPSYGMPRYGAARVYALKGDVQSCVKYLRQLKAMGRGQKKRLDHARTDPGFAKVREQALFKAVWR